MDITIKNRCTWHLRGIDSGEAGWLEVPQDLMGFANDDFPEPALVFRRCKQYGITFYYLQDEGEMECFLESIQKHHPLRVRWYAVDNFEEWLASEQWPTCVVCIGESNSHE